MPPPAGRFRVEEGEHLSSTTFFADQVAAAEAAEVPADVGRAVAAMRRETTDEATYAAGDGLPDAIRLYTAGAVAFRNDERR